LGSQHPIGACSPLVEALLTHTSPQSREMEIIKIKNNKEFKEARKELEMDLPKEVSLTSLG